MLAVRSYMVFCNLWLLLFRLGARIYLITDKIVQTELYRHLFFVRLLDLNDILCLL